MPVAIPNLDPRVIATLVEPQRSANHARRNADRATRINQQDGQSGTSCDFGFNGLKRPLIRCTAFPGILHPKLLEQFLIDDLGGFRGGFTIFDEWGTEIIQTLAPIIPLLAHARIG